MESEQKREQARASRSFGYKQITKTQTSQLNLVCIKVLTAQQRGQTAGLREDLEIPIKCQL